jgi:predicted metallopeptidase
MNAHGPFDFSASMARLCEDICSRVDVFGHIRVEQVAVAFAQARSHVPYGLQARLTPLRFEGGSLTTVRRGRAWTLKRFYRGNLELLYILTFYLPRFLEHPLREKLLTVMHELYHISPMFDGDIRRLGGRCHVHSHSQKQYDRHMETLVDQYLASRPPEEPLAFLQYTSRELIARHGAIVGLRLPVPQLVPLARPA